MSDDDVKKLGENPGKPDLARHKERITDRVERKARYEQKEKGVDKENRSAAYNGVSGILDMLKESEKAVLGAKTQVELVYQLGEMQKRATAQLEKYKEEVKDSRVYQDLKDDGMLYNADRSNYKQVEEKRARLKGEIANGQSQEMVAKLETLEAAESYSNSIFKHEKQNLQEHAESLGIKDPKKTVDGALKMQGLAEEAKKKTKEPSMTIPYATDKEPSKGAGR